MKKALKLFYSTLLSGKGIRAERAKYHAIYYVCSLVSIIHFVTFLLLQIHVLVGVHLLCLVSLQVMKKLAKSDKFFACMLITYFDIYLCEIMVSIWIGWNFGFTYYLFGLIPVIFYLNFSNPTTSKKTRIPIIIILASMVCFLVARYASSFHGPIQPIRSVAVINTIFTINCIICYLIVTSFCALYIVEMKAIQNRLREQNDQLRQLADSDPLTSLLNRRSMIDYLKRALDTYKAGIMDYCIIICDIDDFKQTNDTYGHDCGEMVLIQIADMMREVLGEVCNVSRWGGEEILILVPWDLNFCIAQIEYLRNKLEKYEFVYQEYRLHITMTFGIKAFEQKMTVQELIQLADLNLYEGKKTGKNCIVVKDK